MTREVRPRTRGRGKIVYSLLAVLILVGLAPLGIVAWSLIGSNKEALKTSQQEYQLLLVSSIAGEIDIHVDGLRVQLGRLARMLGGSLAGAASRSPAETRALLDEVADERMLYLRFTDVRGQSVGTKSMAAVPEAMEPMFVSGLVEAAENLARFRETGPAAVSVSPPLLLAGNPPRAVLLLAAPVATRSAYRGTLFALVDLQSVWESVVANHHTGHTVFAVDSRGRLFAGTNVPGAVPGDDLSGSGIVRRFLDSAGGATETAPFVQDARGFGERYLGSYQVTGEGWGVFVQAEERKVYVAVAKMLEDTLRWGLIALSLALLAAVFFAGTLSTPINRLAAASRAFAGGDLSARAAVGARNEIGELAETFNAMASEIEEMIRKLQRAAEENNELFLGTARALASAIDAKDPYTRGHSVRVNRYSVILARYMGLPSNEIADIHIASLLHDVGKIGVDDRILKKPGTLTPEEYEAMKLHTVMGANIMAPIRQMTRMLPGLRSHHERWRGGGYPDGLSGEEIPLMARVIAVADVFDAMTTDRPYQKGMTFEAAVRRINEMKGDAHDDRVVEAFNRAHRAGEFGRKEAAPEPAAVV